MAHEVDCTPRCTLGTVLARSWHSFVHTGNHVRRTIATAHEVMQNRVSALQQLPRIEFAQGPCTAMRTPLCTAQAELDSWGA